MRRSSLVRKGKMGEHRRQLWSMANWCYANTFTVMLAVLVAIHVDAAEATAQSTQGRDSVLETVPRPLTDAGGVWVLVSNMSDEFDASALDESKWTDTIASWGNWSWNPRNVSVSAGRLHLTMTYTPHWDAGHWKYYDSGIVRSRNAIEYGYFEARIRGAKRFPGVAPAFWASQSRGMRGKRTEIDFVELTQGPNPNRIDTNTHVFLYPGLSQPIHESHHWIASFNPTEGFHVYGCEWTDMWIRWYVDGKLVRSRQNAYWHQPLVINLSMGLRRPLLKSPSDLGFPTEMEVDYIRVWRKGN